MTADKATYKMVFERISYDPDAGMFRWKTSDANRTIGSIAGNIHAPPIGHWVAYRRISLFNISYRASHIAWILMTGEWPPSKVDHINGNSTDDRWSNLRLATSIQNQMNRRRNTNNSSGYKGVHYNSKAITQRPWVAQINHKHIGQFATAEEAASAYDREAVKLHGAFAKLNFPVK